MSRLSAADRSIFRRGLGIMMVVIIVGLIAAESQLNDMTQKQEFIHVVNLRRNDNNGIYTAYLLGDSYFINADASGFSAETVRKSITSVAGWSWNELTTKCKELRQDLEKWMPVWRRQFVAEANRTKHFFEQKMLEFRQLLENLIKYVKQRG